MAKKSGFVCPHPAYGPENRHLIAHLKYSVLYFKNIRESGDEASIFSTVCMLLSSLVNQQMFGHTVFIRIEATPRIVAALE